MKKEKLEKFFFLTARNYLHYFNTYNWLKNNSFPLSLSDLILTNTASEKVILLNCFAKKGYKIIFIDDMTYGHESGIVKFYNDSIKELKKSNIRYFGNVYIDKFNNSKYYAKF